MRIITRNVLLVVVVPHSRRGDWPVRVVEAGDLHHQGRGRHRQQAAGRRSPDQGCGYRVGELRRGHRSSRTDRRARRAGGGGGGAARAKTPAPEPCGERAATPPPAGTPNGLTHDEQTEGYYIVSGGGTMVTGGHIVNGRRSAPDSAVTRELNGPSCSGPVVGPDVVTREVKVGDIIIIPARTPHGWVNIPDHVDYLSFRPSARLLTAGYVHPSIKK